MVKNPLEARLKEYAKPLAGKYHGAASWQPNIDAWSERASDNSKIAPRASDGPMVEHDTGKKMEVRDSAMQPKTSRKVDALMAGKGDLNYSGTYLPKVRRGG
jgi:hypothetical protein